MTEAEQDRVLDVYIGYRGAAMTDAESTEFLAEFRAARAEDVEQAIRDTARATGRVLLAGVTHRHALIASERAAAERLRHETAQRARTKGQPAASPGWPVAPGEPPAAYLTAIAMYSLHGGSAMGRRVGARYVEAGLVSREQANRLWSELAPILRLPPGSRWRPALAAVSRAAGEVAVEESEEEAADAR